MNLSNPRPLWEEKGGAGGQIQKMSGSQDMIQMIGPAIGVIWGMTTQKCDCK
jgi:hypothetical protein